MGGGSDPAGGGSDPLGGPRPAGDGALVVLPLRAMGEVPPDGLAALGASLADAALAHGGIAAGDVLAVSSKVVSKALGLRVPEGRREEAVASATVRVVAERATMRPAGPVGPAGSPPRVTRVVEAVAGPVMAAAGVDGSNVGDARSVLLLPEDPDGCADALRAAVAEASGVPAGRLAVVVTDTAGRAWRTGQVDLALGCSGLRPQLDHRGAVDADGRPLAVTSRAVADEIAAAADLVKGKVDGVPAAVLRGLAGLLDPDGPGARSLVRTGPGDWFALGHVEAVRAALGVPPGSAAATEVGLPATGEEPLADRVGRVVALAWVGGGGGADVESAGIDVGLDARGARLIVTGPSPVVVGLLAARLQVAAASEGLAADLAVTGSTATLTLRAAGVTPSPEP